MGKAKRLRKERRDEGEKADKDGTSKLSETRSRKSRLLHKPVKAITKEKTNVKKEIKKKKSSLSSAVLDDLALLTGSLPEVPKKSNEQQALNNPSKPLSAKKRRNILVTEVNHFQRVLSHSCFKANPTQTLDEHLKNVVARS
mmetsp:Transcript_19832/g.32520  ORF Transcript_19832/g.32520 Transcript_19832/m.32520 type:complete len:142 (+) Transcript_19832:197-622(+)|eukprot:CAMPEP_0184656310 /NCGR_PEP_ID=MMETSP0308-20130426/16284_1 /TAXON_ID=38269 /ORGANISM="Gloeochaete witrockiana, Strain SAG 46.84" /LENGTH=141 /DNA_ID=CAMNT_0027093367 /DNA_START=135 /DNA_END=560 /DNA_ORIENTATION=+